MLKALKTRYYEWKKTRFLRKHGCETWHQYHRRYDLDFNMHANRIKDMYQGYPHVFAFPKSKGGVWEQWGDWLIGLTVMREWCDKNCKDKWREDIVEAYHTTYGWEINALSGGVLFFAFKDERDFMMFALRWGG